MNVGHWTIAVHPKPQSNAISFSSISFKGALDELPVTAPHSQPFILCTNPVFAGDQNKAGEPHFGRSFCSSSVLFFFLSFLFGIERTLHKYLRYKLTRKNPVACVPSAVASRSALLYVLLFSSDIWCFAVSSPLRSPAFSFLPLFSMRSDK